jgi:hypothetical protein
VIDAELRSQLDSLTTRQLERAFLDAVRSFAQYAEGRKDVPDRIVVGFAIGFVQGARIPPKVYPWGQTYGVGPGERPL